VGRGGTGRTHDGDGLTGGTVVDAEWTVGPLQHESTAFTLADVVGGVHAAPTADGSVPASGGPAVIGTLPLWLAIALSAAVAQTAYSTLQKRLTADHTELELSYLTAILGAVFLLPVAVHEVATEPIAVSPTVAGVILVSGIVNVGAIFAFLAALSREDLSVVGPLQRLTPVLVAVAEPVVLAAVFEEAILVGAAVTTVGAFVVASGEHGITAPITKGRAVPILLALSASGLFAVASLANRFVTTRTSPLLYAFLIYLIMAVGFAGLLGRRSLPVSRRAVGGSLLVLGVLTATRTSLAYVSFSMAPAAQVTVALQAAIVMDVLAGGLVYGERAIPTKVAGAICIVSGIWVTTVV
jgi:drug/metabolite transporter (DMT)-like permease